MAASLKAGWQPWSERWQPSYGVFVAVGVSVGVAVTVGVKDGVAVAVTVEVVVDVGVAVVVADGLVVTVAVGGGVPWRRMRGASHKASSLPFDPFAETVK